MKQLANKLTVNKPMKMDGKKECSHLLREEKLIHLVHDQGKLVTCIEYMGILHNSLRG